jgi:hypothetical protein
MTEASVSWAAPYASAPKAWPSYVVIRRFSGGHATDDPGRTLDILTAESWTSQPTFAAEVALAALHWISVGHGYDLTAMDAREAHRFALEAAQNVDHSLQIESRLKQMLSEERPMTQWLRRALG